MVEVGARSGIHGLMDKAELERLFPALRESSFRITSPPAGEYNCIAWAAAETGRWWWPAQGYHWPESIPKEPTLTAFRQMYESLGFRECSSPDRDDGFEKVAVFTGPAGTPTHAARQLPNGRWTSKLGREDDIEHDLSALEGSWYGRVALLLRRSSEGSP